MAVSGLACSVFYCIMDIWIIFPFISFFLSFFLSCRTNLPADVNGQTQTVCIAMATILASPFAAVSSDSHLRPDTQTLLPVGIIRKPPIGSLQRWLFWPLLGHS